MNLQRATSGDKRTKTPNNAIATVKAATIAIIDDGKVRFFHSYASAVRIVVRSHVTVCDIVDRLQFYDRQ